MGLLSCAHFALVIVFPFLLTPVNLSPLWMAATIRVFEDEEVSGSAVGRGYCLFSELVQTLCETVSSGGWFGGLTVSEGVGCLLS